LKSLKEPINQEKIILTHFMKTIFLSFLLLLLCSSVVWSQKDVEKAAFLRYKDSCNIGINKHWVNKEYDAALKSLDDLKIRYNNLNKKNRKELNLKVPFYYTYAVTYAAKNDEKSTLKNLKKVVNSGYTHFDPLHDNIYLKYKDNPAFAKSFNKLEKLSRKNQVADKIQQKDIQHHKKNNAKLQIPLTNISVSPANIAQSGSGVEKIADGKCTSDTEIFHTLWVGIPKQDITIEADLIGEGKRLDKIIVTPRAIGGNGIIKTAELWIMTKGEYKRITTIQAEPGNEPIQIEPDTPIRNPQKIKLVITDSYGDMYSNRYMVSLGELECRTMSDNEIRKSQLISDLQLFTIKGIALNPGVTESDIRKMKVPVLKKLASELYNHTFKPGGMTADYIPYQHPSLIAEKMHMSDGFSKFEGITGVVLDEGDNIIYVGDTKGERISLLIPDWTRKTQAGIQPDKDPEGWGLHKDEYSLKEGLNLVHLKKGGNAYIQYFTKDNPANYPSVTVHFITGKVNGYFDITRGDTNKDFDRFLQQAISPILDIRGKNIQIAFPVERLKQYTLGKGVELVRSFDSIVGLEKHLTGWEKEGFIPKNHILARVNFQYYMFRDGDGMAFEDGAMEKVADPKKVTTTECWGIGHEMGHVFQLIPQMTWVGMTEVSNNILTMYCQSKLGNKSRLVEEGRYANAKKHILDKGISYLAFPGKAPKNANIYGEDGKSTNVFERLVPFWQLYLYFKQQRYEDFYPDLMIAMRKQAPLGGNDRNKSYLNMLEFCRLACIVSKTDLTDFFQRWGFFYVGEIDVVDYATCTYQVTQGEIDTLKTEIAGMKLPKPVKDITTIED
jgi:hypothetical protein